MTDAERIEYLEGKVQGLERLSQALVDSTERLWGNLPAGLEWRLGLRTVLVASLKALRKATPSRPSAHRDSAMR